MVVRKCAHCGGRLIPDYDNETAKTTAKCLMCGRTPQEESKVSENSTAAMKGLEGYGLRTPAPVKAPDALDEYTAAARRLLTADAAHAAAVAAERRADNELFDARKAHDAARAKLDAVIGGIAPAEAEPVAEAPKAAGTCKDCGNAPSVKHGRCMDCHRKRQAAYARKAFAKRGIVVSEPVEVSA